MNHSINANRCSRLSARRGQAQGLRPWEPRQRRCLYTPQGASRAGRGEPPLDPAARFLRRLAAEENAWRDSEGWGVFSVAQRKVFFHFTSERTSFAQPPHQSKVLGRWEVGVRGRREEALLQKGFLPPPPVCRASTLPHLKEPRCRMASNAGPFPESSHGTAGLWAAGCPCAWTPRNRSAEREKPD